MCSIAVIAAPAATAVNMGRLLALGKGFPELVPPEVPRQLVVPAAVVTKENGRLRRPPILFLSTAGGGTLVVSLRMFGTRPRGEEPDGRLDSSHRSRGE